MVMDRLSDLPDSLISHILSFLPTKFSAATSILSKRWRYLWTDVPVLDLDSRYLDLESRYHESINSSGRQFSDIINTVLMRHNHRDLHTFRLTSTTTWDPLYDFTDYQIETWISNVTARRLQNLHIGLDDMECCIPPCLFTCKTLVELSLDKCELETPTVLLPSLKKLHLLEVVCVYPESFSNLMSGCPVLEELVIDWTMEFWPRDDFLGWENVRYSVSSPTIKSIKIVHTKDSDEDIEDLGCQYMMDMDTPALEYLKIEDCLSGYISAPTLTSLVEADIRLTVFEDDDELETFSFGSVLEFVDKLYNVESLCLRLHYVESLCLRLSVGDFTNFDDTALATSTVWFHNLKKLELAADWRLLLKFLEYAPNLQVLNIQKVDKCLTYSWEEAQQVHPCLISHLTSIIIHIFEGTEQDLKMVRYFLRNAKILKTMVIYFRADSFNFNERKESQKSISLFERGSPTCKFRFCYDFVEPHTSTYITWCPDLNAFPSCRENC